MASSDNVLRGGLTPKHINIVELMKILRFTPFTPKVLSPGSRTFCYPSPCDDFTLSYMSDDGDGKNIFPKNSVFICLVTDGKLEIAGLSFKKGESFFISTDGEDIVLSGNYSVFAAAEKEKAAISSAALTS